MTNMNSACPWDYMLVNEEFDLDEIDKLATSEFGHAKSGEQLPLYAEQQPQEELQYAPLQLQPMQQLSQQQQEFYQQLPTQQQVQGHTQQVSFRTDADNDITKNVTVLKRESHDVSPGENPQESGQSTSEFTAIMNTAAPSSQTAFTPGQAQTLIMPGGEHVMLLPNQAMGPNQYYLATPSIGTQPVLQQQQQHNTGSVDLPAHNDWPGEYDLQVKIEEKERTVKSPMWMMSSITNKLYTNINKPVPFEIFMQRRPPGVKFNIRATLIYSSQQFMRTNVNRCPNHAAPTDSSNHEFPYPEHVVRADHPNATYEKHPSGRLSVVVPLDNLQDGMEFTPILLRFMCLGSCVGGINRRPIAIILALEDMSGRTVGRRAVHVRVCACPTRDIKSDEIQYQNKGIKRKGSAGHTETKSLTKKTKTREPKLEPADDDDDDDRIYYLPVRGRKMYNYLQEMMLLVSRHFPDHARSSDVEVQAEENLQQKPTRLLD